jgi:hypothetical protein
MKGWLLNVIKLHALINSSCLKYIFCIEFLSLLSGLLLIDEFAVNPSSNPVKVCLKSVKMILVNLLAVIMGDVLYKNCKKYRSSKQLLSNAIILPIPPVELKILFNCLFWIYVNFFFFENIIFSVLWLTKINLKSFYHMYICACK